MDRVTFMMRVKDGHQDEYIRRHQAVWPEVMAEHRRAGVTKMAIYMKGPDLFLYMEAENYAKAVHILNQSPAVLRWEQYMAPIMESAGDDVFDPANPYPTSMPEVFFWEPSERHAEVDVSSMDVSGALPLSAPHISFPRESSVKPRA